MEEIGLERVFPPQIGPLGSTWSSVGTKWLLGTAGELKKRKKEEEESKETCLTLFNINLV